MLLSSILNNGQFYLKYYFLHHRTPPSPPTITTTPFKDIQLGVNCHVLVLIFAQNPKMLKPLQFFIFIALGGMSQSLPKNVLYWRQQTDVTETSFLSIFLKMLLCIVVFPILAIGEHIDMLVNIFIKFVETPPKDGWKMFLGDVGIMMFYGCPKNDNLTHSTKFITKTLLKYSFNVPPKDKNNRFYPMCHKIAS